MKVLTLTQPWATLVAIGAKHIETRSWETLYRGSLAIHAGKGLGSVGGKRAFWQLQERSPFMRALRPADFPDFSRYPDGYPFGAIVATCELRDCRRIPNNSIVGWGEIDMEHDRAYTWDLTDQERAFGDYTPGRFAWLLADVRALPEPIPAKGALGLWQPDTLTEMAITRQLIRAIQL